MKSDFVAFLLGAVPGTACIVWGLVDWLVHRNSEDIDAGGDVLFWRLFIGAMFIMVGIYRLEGWV